MSSFATYGLVIVAFALAVAAIGIRQEVILFEKVDENEQGNFYTFQRGVPDIYFNLSEVKQYCRKGAVAFYSGSNFQKYYTHSVASSICVNGLLPTSVKSFRHLGASSTIQNAVSLYGGPAFEGEEILVDRSPYAAIDLRIASLAVTGVSSWTIFEGRNFNGKFGCLQAPEPTLNITVYKTLSSLGVSTVGSLFRGCADAFTFQFLSTMRTIWEHGGSA